MEKQGGSGGGAARGGPGSWASVRAPLAGASVLRLAGVPAEPGLEHLRPHADLSARAVASPAGISCS